MYKYKLLIFDWDGTLLDSAAFIVHSMQQAATDLNIAVPTTELIRNGIGVPFSAQMDRLFPDVDATTYKAIIDRYRHYVLTSKQLPELFPGVVAMLKQLHQAGYLLAVATSKSRQGLNAEIKRHQLEGLFAATRTGDEAHSKPHPQMLMDILAELDIDPQAALMVGDTEYDLQMALNAGVKSVGVSHGVHTEEQLLKFKPLVVLDDVCKLPEWLNASRVD